MKIFLDVGAHKGETIKIAQEAKYGFDKLFAFEPVPGCWDAIRSLKDKRVVLCEYGLWNENCVMRLYNPGNLGASVYNDKWAKKAAGSLLVRFVRASEWFAAKLKIEDRVYLKLNCEGAEYEILDDLIKSKEYKKIDVAMIDFDIRKIPSKKHLVKGMKDRLNVLGIPKIFYIDEYNLGKKTHNYFSHFWLDNSMQ